MDIKMKIAVFGSTGNTGRQLVKQALDNGYKVTAFARSPEKIDQKHINLQVVKGDVLDLTSVERAIEGQDAVFCALGLPNIMDKSKLRTKGTKNIIDAMKKTAVKRLVCLSSFGVGDSYQSLPLHYKYFIAPLFMRALYDDHNRQENAITESLLDWTVVRPSILYDGDFTGCYQHALIVDRKTAKMKISRADTADFMLKQLVDNAYLHKMPCVSS